MAVACPAGVVADATGVGCATTIALWYRAGGCAPIAIASFAPMVDAVMAGRLDALATRIARDIAAVGH